MPINGILYVHAFAVFNHVLTISPRVFDMNSSISKFGHAHSLQTEISVKINNKMANSVDPDETAHYELSHLDLQCLQRCVCV